MISCSFELNDKPMSAFGCGASKYPAFSGFAPHINKRLAACMKSLGPIPPGMYYICDRPSGGMLGPLRDLAGGRSQWFALYAADGKVDDETLCNEVMRGNFRLHPRVGYGISKGCITLNSEVDFYRVASSLRAMPMERIPGSALLAYGKVTVR